MNKINHFPRELMQSFAKSVEPGGDATAAAQMLGPRLGMRCQVRRPLNARDLLGLPVFLPVPDVGSRQQLDSRFKRLMDKLPNVVLEIGGKVCSALRSLASAWDHMW